MPSSDIEAKVGLSSPRLDFWGLASSAKSASIRGEVSLLVVVRARKMKCVSCPLALRGITALKATYTKGKALRCVD